MYIEIKLLKTKDKDKMPDFQLAIWLPGIKKYISQSCDKKRPYD